MEKNLYYPPRSGTKHIFQNINGALKLSDLSDAFCYTTQKYSIILNSQGTILQGWGNL